MSEKLSLDQTDNLDHQGLGSRSFFRETAKDKCNLRRLGITHVLNAAEGTWNNVDTGAGYYSDMDVVYHGVVAEDTPTFDLSQYFYSAASFIEETLSNPQSKTTPNCHLQMSSKHVWSLQFDESAAEMEFF